MTRIAKWSIQLILLIILAAFQYIILRFFFEKISTDIKYLEVRKPEIRPKIILFGSSWYWQLGSNHPYLEQASHICSGCIFTQEKRFLNVSDAVVLHGFTLHKIPTNFTRHSPKQIWIWMFEESPQKAHDKLANMEKYRNFFNWTLNFRRDSDVYSPYGRFVPINQTPIPAFNETWAFLPSDVTHESGIYNKKSFLAIPTLEDLKGRKLIAWISSHCRTASQREVIVSELGKYVPIDIYGNCGNLSCGSDASYMVRTGLTGNSGIDCRLKIEKTYKFYLAFENSLCEDYVTEKYFDTLLTQMVPIVYGLANYSVFAPEKSFINIADFESLEDLADYLLYLDKHPIEFLKYFEWRKKYWVQNNPHMIAYCTLCNKLWNLTDNITKFYPDIKEWYMKRSDYVISGKSACIKPKEYHTNVTGYKHL